MGWGGVGVVAAVVAAGVVGLRGCGAAGSPVWSCSSGAPVAVVAVVSALRLSLSPLSWVAGEGLKCADLQGSEKFEKFTEQGCESAYGAVPSGVNGKSRGTTFHRFGGGAPGQGNIDF